MLQLYLIITLISIKYTWWVPAWLTTIKR